MQTAKKILITRPAQQAEKLCELIAQQGWQAIRFPVIEIQARQLSVQDNMRVQGIESYQYVFFVSVNAVNFAHKVFNGRIECLQKVSCVAVGNATHTALVAHGIKSVLVPVEGFNSEAVLAMPELQALINQSCLIIRGEGGRELLADSLRYRGATVDYLEVYKRVLPKCDCRLVEEYIHNKQLTAIFIYSGDALKNLVQLLAKEKISNDMLKITLVVISQRVKELAQKIGFKNIIIAKEASDTAMIYALLNGEECG